MRYHDPDCRERLAGEYVLGTLQGRARRRFERLLQHDAALRESVDAWTVRLQPLDDDIAPVVPPPQVWAGIIKRLKPPGHGLWDSLAFWRGFGLAAASAVLALGLLLTLVTFRADGPDYMVVVADQQAEPIWLIRTGADAKQFTVKTMRPSGMPPEKACVLWLVWNDGVMQSFGPLPERPGVFTLPMPAGMDRRPEKAKVVVSVEPAADPALAPSAEIVYRGDWLTL